MDVAGEAIEFDHGSRILRIRTNALRVNNANRSRKNWGPSCLSIGLAGVNCTSAQTGCCCSCFFAVVHTFTHRQNTSPLSQDSLQ